MLTFFWRALAFTTHALLASVLHHLVTALMAALRPCHPLVVAMLGA